MAQKYVALKEIELQVLEKTKKFKLGQLYQFDTFIKVWPEYFQLDGDINPVINVILDCGNSVVLDEDMYLFDFNNLYSRIK